MGRKKVKDGQITFDDCVSHAISEPENGQVNMTLKLDDKPVEVITLSLIHIYRKKYGIR